MGHPGYECETLKLSEHANLLGKNTRSLDETENRIGQFWVSLKGLQETPKVSQADNRDHQQIQ